MESEEQALAIDPLLLGPSVGSRTAEQGGFFHGGCIDSQSCPEG